MPLKNANQMKTRISNADFLSILDSATVKIEQILSIVHLFCFTRSTPWILAWILAPDSAR